MWQNVCFKAIFSVCFGILIIIWQNLRPRNNLIIFYISLERPRVFEICSQNEGRVGYLSLESSYSSRSSTINFLHSRKVMAQGSRWENVCAWRFFFLFCDLIPHFLLLSLSLSLPFLLPFLAHFVFWAI